jgi:hypothetical protein
MLGGVPWAPELFTAPALQHVLDRYRRDHMRSVPFFDGLLAGEPDALVASFAGVPVVRHPVQGRIEGEAAFRAFVAETAARLEAGHAGIEPVDHVLTDTRGVEEVVLHLDHEGERVETPWAMAADHDADERLIELRVYFSPWPLSDRRAERGRLLAPVSGLEAPDVAGEYVRALAAGDVAAVLATFEPDGYVRAPSGAAAVHRGADALRGVYERLFADGGGLVLEPCTVTDDGRVCALEYNMIGRGAPVAALAVLTRGASGRLAAVRVYDDVEPLAGERR